MNVGRGTLLTTFSRLEERFQCRILYEKLEVVSLNGDQMVIYELLNE